jgi:hypothetical protein
MENVVNVSDKTIAERREILKAAGNEFFTAVFIKRSTGEKRVMNCRLHVKAHLKGGEQPYNAEDHGLLTVFDNAKKDYRNIALESLLSATINHVRYVFEE